MAVTNTEQIDPRGDRWMESRREVYRLRAEIELARMEAETKAKRQALIEQTAMRLFCDAVGIGHLPSDQLSTARKAWAAAEIFVDARPEART